MFSPAGQAWLHGGKRSRYTGRLVRHAPVLLARLEPTSSVIANGLSMAVPLEEPEALDVAVGDPLNQRESATLGRLGEQMRKALLQPQVVFNRHLAADLGAARDFAVFRFEQWEQARFDREPGDLDGVGRLRAPAQRARHMNVNVARTVDAHCRRDFV